ncbi:MAG: acetylxylan esterase [Bryobacteraceae bacterium]
MLSRSLRAAVLVIAAVFLQPAHVLTQTRPAPPKEVAGIPVNYDEAHVGNYTLPDPLRLTNGKPVRDAKTWYTQRRPEVVRLFEENQFGRSPGAPTDLTYDCFDTGTPAFEGTAIRKQTTIYFSRDKTGPKMDLLVYLPAKTQKPAPLLLSISFTANSVTVSDPGVKEREVWNREHKKVPGKLGMAIGKIDVVPLIHAGFGFATVYYGDIEPDFDGGLRYGVRALYLKPGQTQPAPDEWGAIAAWGWGLSRVLDYLERDPGIDGKRVALYGASRLGKTVLWAGARDTRFAAVIACCSGEGGAALSRRNYGETIAHLTAPSRYPYQFCANYARFAQHVDQLPVDANMLIALMAPRPLLLQTGDTDYWSDPKGEFLAEKAAGPVYALLGKQGLDTNEWPPAGVAIMHTLSYYMHSGGHGTLPSDWPQFLKFLQIQLDAANTAPSFRSPS